MQKEELRARATDYAIRVRPEGYDYNQYDESTMKAYRDGWKDAEQQAIKKACKWLETHVGKMSFVTNWFENDKLVKEFVDYIKQ